MSYTWFSNLIGNSGFSLFRTIPSTLRPKIVPPAYRRPQLPIGGEILPHRYHKYRSSNEKLCLDTFVEQNDGSQSFHHLSSIIFQIPPR